MIDRERIQRLHDAAVELGACCAHGHDTASGASIARFNPNHYGPGPQGGQFAPSGDGGGLDENETTHRPNRSAQLFPPSIILDEPPIIVDPPFDEYPTDLTKPPGPGWQWRGQDAPGGPRGSWYNPRTQEWLRNDPDHPEPVGPHIDYKAPDGTEYRWFPDGRFIPKKP